MEAEEDEPPASAPLPSTLTHTEEELSKLAKATGALGGPEVQLQVVQMVDDGSEEEEKMEEGLKRANIKGKLPLFPQHHRY